MFAGLVKLILQCFKNADDPNHPEGFRELIRKGMLARLADDRAEGILSASLHAVYQRQVFDTPRLSMAIKAHEEVREFYCETLLADPEERGYIGCYDILLHWK